MIHSSDEPSLSGAMDDKHKWSPRWLPSPELQQASTAISSSLQTGTTSPKNDNEDTIISPAVVT